MKPIKFSLIAACVIMLISFAPEAKAPQPYEIKLKEREVNAIWKHVNDVQAFIVQADMNNKFNVQAVQNKLDSVKMVIWDNLPDSIKSPNSKK